MLRQGGWVLVAIGLVSIIAWTLVLREWQRVRERTASGWATIRSSVDALQAGQPLDTRAIAGLGDNFVAKLHHLSIDFRGRGN